MAMPFALLSYLKHSTGYSACSGVKPAEYTKPKTKTTAITPFERVWLMAMGVPLSSVTGSPVSGSVRMFVALRAVTATKMRVMRAVLVSSCLRRPHLSVKAAPRRAPDREMRVWKPFNRRRVWLLVMPAPCRTVG